MHEIKRRDLLAGGTLLGGLLMSGCTTGAGMNGNRTTGNHKGIRPGEIWLDTAGKPIQAHAGALIAVGRDFYWYGENKEFTDGKQGKESWGIRFYRSRNLYDWDDLGPIIPPDLSDASSPLSPTLFPERPHILFNPRTRKFVCWIKIRSPRVPYQYRTVLTADRITGPYEMVHRHLRPLGMSAGDFDVVIDQKSGKAYMLFEHDHKEVVSVELSEDWTDVTDRFTRHFPDGRPPNTHEGIACFQRNGKFYLTSSKMTGYFPNPSSVAIGADPRGPFTDQGNLHPSDQSGSSFNSQISYIFKHPGKRDLYIALADRWLPQFSGQPEFESGELPAQVRSAIGKAMAKPRQPLTEAERKALPHAAALTNVNTSISRYVWLPLTFRDDRPLIEWHAEWRIEDYA